MKTNRITAPLVHTFNMKRIDDLVKQSDKELQQYIHALEENADGWKSLFHDAMKKLRNNENALMR